jgi:N-acetylglutamate synthase-like GNAT family acetyltransferase
MSVRPTIEPCGLATAVRKDVRAPLQTSAVRQFCARKPLHAPRRVEAMAHASSPVEPLSRLFTWAQEALRRRERIIFSSEKPSGKYIRDLAELWARDFHRPELLQPAGLLAVQKAIDHSFTVCVAFAETTEMKDREAVGTNRRLIGCARTVSDAVFAAQVVDVSVDPEYRSRGVGTTMLRNLCKETREAGAQSIAVFTGPDTRLFFWKTGFRMDFRYKIMVYDAMKTSTRKEDVSVEELSEIFGTPHM